VRFVRYANTQVGVIYAERWREATRYAMLCGPFLRHDHLFAFCACRLASSVSMIRYSVRFVSLCVLMMTSVGVPLAAAEGPGR